MNLQGLQYVIGNANALDQNKNRQMEAIDATQVVVADRRNENQLKDKWNVISEPGNDTLVSFQSEAYKDKYLNPEDNSSLVTAGLKKEVKQFRLEPVPGENGLYYIQMADDRGNYTSYLTMDDPQGGKKINFMAKMSDDTHKQKWKFKSASGSSAGTN